jgi:sulfate transport system ATP-binding protein
VYDKPASPFVYRFLGNVNVLKPQSLLDGGLDTPRENMDEEGLVYVRPHDIELVPHQPGAQGIPAVVRYIHAAGPQARLSLEQVRSREPVEVEISRAELVALGLKPGDLTNLRLRAAHSFNEDYAI